MKNKFQFGALEGPKFVELPYEQPVRRDGKWARERAKRLVEEVFPDVELTRQQYLTLMGQLSGWLAVCRTWKKVGTILAAYVIVDDPRKGVDSYVVYTMAGVNESLDLPHGVTTYDIHGTPLAAPRVTEVFDHPLGPAAFSYSLRESSFSGVPAITRNVEHYILPREYPITLTFHLQWADPHEDPANRLLAEKVSNAILLVNRDEPPAP